MSKSNSFPSERRLSKVMGMQGLLGTTRLAFGAKLEVFCLIVLLAGCKPSIGDDCRVSVDCSSNGDRVCDTSQPGGYCTLLGCRGNTCPDNAACVLFGANIPGCGPDGRGLSRTGRSFCAAACEGDSDCRAGYVCRSPKERPWLAMVLDEDQGKRACLPATVPVDLPDAAAPVCGPIPADAGTVLQDAGVASQDAGRD